MSHAYFMGGSRCGKIIRKDILLIQSWTCSYLSFHKSNVGYPGTEPVPPRLEGDVQSPELPNYGIEWVVLILRVSRARVCWVFVIFLFSCKFWGCTLNRLRPLASASFLFHIRKEMSPYTQLRSCCQDSVSHRSWMNEWVDDSWVSHLCYSNAWTM